MKIHSKEEKKQKDWSRFWIEKGFEVCEIFLKKTSTSFCVGNQISLADLCLIPQVYNALRFELSLRKFPTIERIYHNALQTKECKASHPEQFSPKK